MFLRKMQIHGHIFVLFPLFFLLPCRRIQSLLTDNERVVFEIMNTFFSLREAKKTFFLILKRNVIFTIFSQQIISDRLLLLSKKVISVVDSKLN